MSADLLSGYQQDMLADLVKLIQFKTVRGAPASNAPFGAENRACLDFILARAAAFGFDCVDLDGYGGYVQWGTGDELMLIATHLDVVPTGDGWTYPPFEVVIDNGRLYGRGASDDKGAAVGALYCLKAMKDTGLTPKRKIRLFFGCGEESGMEDLDYYLEQEGLPTVGLVPDGGYPICNMEKGILVVKFQFQPEDTSVISLIKCEGAANVVPDTCSAIASHCAFDFKRIEAAATAYSRNNVYPIKAVLDAQGDIVFTAYGKSVHASTPEYGYHAMLSLCKFLHDTFGNQCGSVAQFIASHFDFNWDGAQIGCQCSDASGALTCNVGTIDCQRNGGHAIMDIRYPVTKDGTALFTTIREIAQKNNVKTELIVDVPPMMVSPESTLVQDLQRSYKEITGEEATLFATGGGTYARKLENRGVSFGPSFSGMGANNIHRLDEYVVIDDLMKHNEIYTNVMHAYLFASG